MITDIYDTYATQPVRGTQRMVDHMAWVFRRPRITLLEIAWRWIFVIPFLWVCWRQVQLIAIALPPDAAGVGMLNTQNPWIDGVQLGVVWMRYVPYVVHVLYWLVPAGLITWSVMAGLGRGLVLKQIEPEVPYRPLPIMFLQGCWLALLLATVFAWYECIQWIAATHIVNPAAPDLVGYSVWAIFASLGLFTLWAVINWPFTIACVLVLEERRSVLSALAEAFRLGKTFTAELIEINLTMGIVTLMLIVLAMVFSSAPVPFAAELGNGALHFAIALSFVFYCVASDYFQVVRLKAFVEFWHMFRGPAKRSAL
ncbi:MAG TPA: hypothetical protein VGS10_13165 [Terracidiphilus sp.]|nr:hypothetical protein [Terracidiphilus sp.]